MLTWFFEARDPYGVHSVPKNDEHFANVRGIVASLVRETTQNSGDANDEATGKPVTMRFRFGKIEAARFAEYVGDLQVHLAAFPSFKKLLDDARVVPFLAIEDFETHGLRGSYDPRVEASDSSYVAFWHRYGESGKKAEHGGRHGLGKSTVASASRMRMFFGATVPSDSKKLMLQGQISLKPHQITVGDGEERTYDAYGLWYDKGSDGKPLPLFDRQAAGFLHDFKLSRGRNPGLSLVIPFPDEDLSASAIVAAMI
jgi:hypothetical protein